ncbi:MAG TPA: alpha/beta fold hydrolase [Mycobacteriales bacterium]|nr:alpha/beta fold hydrolase [Mycobacteriales bacterium]
MAEATAVAAGETLESAVRSRMRSEAGSALAGVRARVVLDAGDDSCTIDVAGGRVTVRSGAPASSTTLIRGDRAVLLDVVSGRRSGVEAFLDRRIAVEGNLALCLQLDALFDPAHERPARFPRSGMTRAAGVRTAYLEAGPDDGLPVVALHGLGATNASLLPTVWDLAADHRVLAPDLPGHGASAAPLARYDAAFFSRWLTSFLDDRGIDRAVLLGNSLGGRVALEVALDAPDRVAGLALLSPAVAFRRLRQFVPLVRLLRPEAAALPLPMTRGMAQRSLQRMFSRPDRLTPQSYEAAAGEFVRVYRSRAHRVAFFSAMRSIYLDDAFGTEGFWTRLPGLVPPALFVWGDRDRLVPAGFARHVVASVPHATSVVLPDCGHVPQFERPEQTHALVREFLETLPDRRWAGRG